MTEVITAEQYRRQVAHTQIWRKFRNQPQVIDGQRFDSKREARRHYVLADMEQRGEIEKLERQVTFDLVVNGVLVGRIRPDWTYIEGDKVIAEDCKGAKPAVWQLRWKLAQALYPLIEWRLS
ncbi:MAG: DUF1064 domain-containing protein [Proteobacteria bacterium]|nr:DUF1064 domain-containing protein [Pseudomonadota bacterium]